MDTNNNRRVLHVQVAADLICPWCFIGKRSLGQAVALLAREGIDVEVEWLPYQLNPTMPAEGMDRREFRTQRFGWPQSLAMDARAVEAGKRVGASFQYELQSRTPNTLAAHGLVRRSRTAGGAAMQDRVVDALFEAYFEEGQDIGNEAVLAGIAEKAGLDPDTFEASRADRREIAAIEHRLRAVGVTSVPSYFVDGRLLATGSDTVQGYVRWLSEAAESAG